MPHIIRKLQAVPRDSHGMSHDGRWFPAGPTVWEFDVAFYPSYVTFETSYVRAKDGGKARDKIRAQYPDAVRYDF